MSRYPASRPRLAQILLIAGLAVSGNVLATNGYVSHGYGNQSKGAVGVGAALPQDALITATNPAGLLYIGDRLDVGIDYFAPRRKARITGNAFGPDATYDGNSTESFYIPELGYSKQYSDKLAAGLAIYGNGGMNTDYDDNPYARYGATGRAGVNLEQLFIAPAVAFRITPNSSVGIALNLAYQRFRVRGIQPFAVMSSDPANLTNNGHDSSTGWGLRLGWQGQVSEDLSLGVSWQSKTYMSEFDDYAGLFANQGDFDIPENYVAGLAWKATDQLTVALDWQRVLYSEVEAVGNSASQLALGYPLGSDNGPGFGWRDIDVVKLGFVYEASPRLTLRAGYSESDQPVPEEETFFNILAPGVVEEHASIGATWEVNQDHSITFAYTYCSGEWIEGQNSIPPSFGGGEADVYLRENVFGLQWNIAL